MASSWWRQLKDAVRRSPAAPASATPPFTGAAGLCTAHVAGRPGDARPTPGTLWHPGVPLRAKHGGTFRALPEHTCARWTARAPRQGARGERDPEQRPPRMIGTCRPEPPRHRDRFLALTQEEEDDEYEEEKKEEEESRIVRERETEELSAAAAAAPAPAAAAAATVPAAAGPAPATAASPAATSATVPASATSVPPAAVAAAPATVPASATSVPTSATVPAPATDIKERIINILKTKTVIDDSIYLIKDADVYYPLKINKIEGLNIKLVDGSAFSFDDDDNSIGYWDGKDTSIMGEVSLMEGKSDDIYVFEIKEITPVEVTVSPESIQLEKTST